MHAATSMKRGNDEVFSPASPESQRLKMDCYEGLPIRSTLSITDKDIDVDELKAACPEATEWSMNLASYLSNTITSSIEKDVNQSMEYNHGILKDVADSLTSTIENAVRDLK